jgi:glycosyltransferase involved in cell wall biosynthesis
MENNIPKFTFCITSKNNLRYLKHAVSYIKQNSVIEHNILVFIDADNDGTEKWCIENNIKFIKNSSKELFGIGNAYNLLVDKAETDFVVIYHADMIMGKGFDVALYNNWKPKTVVSATRIEPPLHPADPAKIVLDLGLWPETDIKDGFKVDEFNTFVEQNKKDLITNGIFAPWLIHKDDFNNVGGHDPIMKSHSEDRDLFNRFLLNGYELIQSWEALVYHLTCRGGQFEHANETKDLTHKSGEWNRLAHNQTREFIRKWGTPPKYNEFQYPVITPKYNVAFVIEHCNSQMLEALEPWCDRIYIDDELGILFAGYYETEHKNTSYDLKKRVLSIKYNDPIGENDIVIKFDAHLITNENFKLLIQLPEIIKDNGEVGTFELDIFKVTINSMDEYQNDLIYLKND